MSMCSHGVETGVRCYICSGDVAAMASPTPTDAQIEALNFEVTQALDRMWIPGYSDAQRREDRNTLATGFATLLAELTAAKDRVTELETSLATPKYFPPIFTREIDNSLAVQAIVTVSTKMPEPRDGDCLPTRRQLWMVANAMAKTQKELAAAKANALPVGFWPTCSTCGREFGDAKKFGCDLDPVDLLRKECPLRTQEATDAG